MSKDRNLKQIIRKDARGCFVESLNDVFSIGKAHLAFVAYDLHSPAGQRQTWILPSCWSSAGRRSRGSCANRCRPKSGTGTKALCISAWAAPLRNGCGSWESPGPTA